MVLDFLTQIVEYLKNETKRHNLFAEGYSNVPQSVQGVLLAVGKIYSKDEVVQILSSKIPHFECNGELETLIRKICLRNEIVHVLDNKEYFDPKFNRIFFQTYLSDQDEPDFDQFLKTCFIQTSFSGYPYHCPSGWRRYGLKVDNFDKLYNSWPVAYHGSKSENIVTILHHGILSTSSENFALTISQNGDIINFSPSIEYCGHPNFAEPLTMTYKNKKFYVQIVFQCRVKPGSFIKRKQSILVHQNVVIDSNYKNDELEWLVTNDSLKSSKKQKQKIFVIYGIMARVTDQHPSTLDKNKWWNK